jgi:hypothetical protein
MNNNVVIKQEEDFEKYFKLTDLDKTIMNGALNLNSGQSLYQSQVFVAKSQLTPYKMAKQCLLELESRHHSWFGISNKLKKKKIEIKIAQREYDITDDDLRKEMISVDMEDMRHDIDVWERKIIQAAEEIKTYIDIIKNIVGDDSELLEKAFTYDHQEEQKYWITRMAKQAAMDMISYGRISSGNMDSIAMMPEEDQIMTLATCLQYNERLLDGMSQISQAVKQGLLENTENLPKYKVPSITDKLLTKDFIEDIQFTTKPKIGPESI